MFEPNKTLFSIIKNLFFVIYAIDVFVTCNTYKFVKGDQLKKRVEIIKGYLKKNAFTDLLVFSSNNWIMLPLKQNSEVLSYTDILSILVIANFTKVDNYFSFIIDYSRLNRNGTYVMRILRLGMIVIIFTHIITCVWLYIVQIQDSIDFWIQSGQEINESVFDKYVLCFYWVIATMSTIGYGDFTPQTPVEKLFSIAIIIASIIIFAYTVNNIGIILNDVERKDIDAKLKVAKLNEYLREMKVSPELESKINSFMQFALQGFRGNYIKSQKVLGLLKPDLKNQINQSLFYSVLKKHRILSKIFSDNFLRNLSHRMKIEIYLPMEIIIDVIICNLGIQK